MRSGYEVIFAQYLLRHRISFEYEPRRIKLTPSTVYIPDFYLPDTDTWVEVKGYAADSWLRKRAMFERAGYRLLVVTRASIASYLPDEISYSTWLRRNGHKYLRNP
jgi:predicted nuclease of restriction endonuclease-like RecB superfamily